jgi:hypothetical protein
MKSVGLHVLELANDDLRFAVRKSANQARLQDQHSNKL